MQEVYAFAEFRVDVAERLLSRGGERVPLTPKVYELLLVLLENRGKTLEKEEIARRLWPDMAVVDHANLSRNIFLLRKALGDGENGRRWIETVPKRGYRFIADVQAPVILSPPDESNQPAQASESIVPIVDEPPPTISVGELPASATTASAQSFLSSRHLVVVSALLILLTASVAYIRIWQRRNVPGNEAQQLSLKGRHLWNKRTPETLQKGIALFQQAIDLDPSFAPAHAGLADGYAMLGEYQLSRAQEAFPKAKAAAQRALALDERLAEAHIALACVLYFYDWDFPAAEREFRRGLELQPDYATAHQWYSDFLTSQQRFDEALAAIRRARTLDPLSPIIATAEGGILYHAHRYDEAIAALEKTLEWEPGYPAALTYLAMALTEKGAYDAALRCYEQAAERSGRDVMLPGLAYVNARAGHKDAADQLIAQMKAQANAGHYSSLYWALVYVGVGDHEESLRWLEQCYAERNPWLVHLRTDPRFDRWRDEPRLQRLLPH